jgi:GTPase
MASIFTFDPDPPRVSSPWLTPRASTPAPITRLEAEPQEGPTEYKLHLLLRRRRDYRSTSTSLHVPGSHRSVSASPKPTDNSETWVGRSPHLQEKSMQTRQQRFEQLTTQLLWRLQQSCPHHATSANKQITPVFPKAGDITTDVEVGPPAPGLEESLGALYEIGVADDGTFVGLTEDEMAESLENLMAMAASLGCVVDVLRKVSVGRCEYYENGNAKDDKKLHEEKLWVVEAYVKPNSAFQSPSSGGVARTTVVANASKGLNVEKSHAPVQLTVSLTGPTMSGKSTLLGSLTTATLDNGRGKSRLSLLKHRHEIVSGMTSSVTQELLGYTQEGHGTVQVVNYASNSVSSWTDIHSTCKSGRIVLLSDSAGHPRYRRTTLRGIIGWSPDWTLLCLPADNAEDTSGLVGSTPPTEEVLGITSADVDLSQTHLDLCLKLNLRLVIAITKLDLISKAGLRQSLAKILSTLKAAGRTPTILANPSSLNDDLMTIPASVYAKCGETAFSLSDAQIVPIVLTSAVKGDNIATLHALLCQLPIPVRATATYQLQPYSLFHVEDTYTVSNHRGQEINFPVLSGILGRGQLTIGDELWLGPFTIEQHTEQRDTRPNTSDRPSIPTSRSFPGALNSAKSLPPAGNVSENEWLKVRVTSLRHLRLPVTTLLGSQVGTVGIQLVNVYPIHSRIPRIRKGMVLASELPEARKGFVAEFARSDVDSLSISMGVVVYIASVRASAKVVAGTIPDDESMESSTDSLLQLVEDNHSDEGAFAFSFEQDLGTKDTRNSGQGAKVPRLHVTFQFIATKEYLDNGSQVLVMPGGGPGLYVGNERGEKGIAGLEGFVGTIVSAY